MLDALAAFWPHFVSALAITASVLASIHAILYKRDVRAAIGWVGIVWLVPLVGAALYVLLGVNRVRRRALKVRGGMRRYLLTSESAVHSSALLQGTPDHLRALAELGDRIAGRRLLDGNDVIALRNGDRAYPDMIDAIAGAERSVSLLTYIFDTDEAGLRFIDALAAAKKRGVEVRVLVDDAGARYAHPPASRLLSRGGVRAARFMPAWRPRKFPFFNLRNHRKILVVDGRIGFTGGMNIRGGCLLESGSASRRAPLASRHLIQDLHFRLTGPITAQLQEVFAEDWAFTTREHLEGEAWFPALEPTGTASARGIADGPDEDFEKVRWTMLGAIACARRSVRVVTPYFLPDPGLWSALQIAALRGVEVDVVIPEHGNIPLVQWATWGQLGLDKLHTVRLWCSPPPFDHSKVMVVDGHWILIGSANWDPRSLRLNFEFCVEVFDSLFGAEMESWVALRVAASRRVTAIDLAARRLPQRMRDGAARLLSPYL